MEIFRRILFWNKYFFIMLFDTLNCIDFHVHGLNIRVLCETNFLTIRIFGFYQVTTDFSVQKEASFVTIKKQDFLAIIAPESFSDHFRRQLVCVLDSG